MAKLEIKYSICDVRCPKVKVMKLKHIYTDTLTSCMEAINRRLKTKLDWKLIELENLNIETAV